MDTPGYDPVSATGMVAGGANLICFTTGRGSVFGCRPVPTRQARHQRRSSPTRMTGDIDFDCSGVVEAGIPLEEMGGGSTTCCSRSPPGTAHASEELGLGGEEIVPWQIGAVL